jgi:tetratricopeptide (TPR) repeat protein
MKARYMAWIGAGALMLLLGAAGFCAPAAQGQDKPSLQKDKDAKKEGGVPAPVNAEEEAAYKAYDAAGPGDLATKAKLGEEFLQKYPESRYRPLVFSTLTMTYYNAGQIQKMVETGAKDVELTPTDVNILALLGQIMPRVLSKDPAEAGKQLTLAEGYAKRAVEITPTIPKPPALTEESFAAAKNVVLAMAHSGLGLIHIKRQKYSEAIPELELAVKLDAQPDPVNYFLLGLANENASHFDDAAAAFTKCAAIPGQLQATCKAGIAEAKKKAETELSAPK